MPKTAMVRDIIITSEWSQLYARLTFACTGREFESREQPFFTSQYISLQQDEITSVMSTGHDSLCCPMESTQL